MESTVSTPEQRHRNRVLRAARAVRKARETLADMPADHPNREWIAGRVAILQARFEHAKRTTR